MIIKWIRIKSIASVITGKNIELLLSTILDNNVISAVVYPEKTTKDTIYTIVLNGERIKSLSDVIKAICHEMVHIVYPKIKHGKQFDEHWNNFISYFTPLYETKENING